MWLRPLIPVFVKIFNSLYNTSHPSRRATKQMVSSCCLAVLGCSSSDSQGPRRCPLPEFPHTPEKPQRIPVNCFSHIHVDIVGLLLCFTQIFSFAYCGRLVMSFCWLQALLLTDTSAASCAESFSAASLVLVSLLFSLLIEGWITSSLWSAVCNLFSLSHSQTTAHHP